MSVPRARDLRYVVGSNEEFYSAVSQVFNLQRVEIWFVVITFNTPQIRNLRNSSLKSCATRASRVTQH